MNMDVEMTNPPAPVLGIIADDFTGAMLVAGTLEAAGIYAPVVFDSEGAAMASGADVAILATRARVAPKAEACAEIAAGAAALARAGCPRLAYKACASFDSTETGNIGPAADLLSDRAAGKPVLMSAGFPMFNATVHQGYLFYRKRLVSESVKRLDPLTPMSDPDLVRFLSHQTRSPVALIPHRVLLEGAQAARAEWDRLRGEGAQYILADTTDDLDVACTRDLALDVDPVVVASDPLIIAYAKALAEGRAPAPPPLDMPKGPGAVLIGSVGPTAIAQIASFVSEGHSLLTLNILAAESEEAIVASALAWAGARIGDQPFAIATTVEPDLVEKAQRALGQIPAARKAERLLAAIARGLQERGLRRLVVSGGETSGAVVAALGIGAVRALPEGPLGSGFCIAESPVPMVLFLKSGKLGADNVFARALKAMEG